MTNMFLDHPFLLAMCLFVFPMAVVDTGFRLAVLTRRKPRCRQPRTDCRVA
jgi:hypothetical protein